MIRKKIGCVGGGRENEGKEGLGGAAVSENELVEG